MGRLAQPAASSPMPSNRTIDRSERRSLIDSERCRSIIRPAGLEEALGSLAQSGSLMVMTPLSFLRPRHPFERWTETRWIFPDSKTFQEKTGRNFMASADDGPDGGELGTGVWGQ